MVKVEVFDKKKDKTYSYYMDDRLKRNLDKKVIPTLKKKDEDYVICVDGMERIGKSVFAMQLAKYVDPTFDLDRVCFSAEEFKDAILKANKFQAVIFDEAYSGLGSASALSKTNKMLKALMTEMGQKNLFVIIVLPSFYLLEKYPALWRTRVLFHVFKNRTGKKGFFRLFNNKKKKILYIRGKKDYDYNIKKAKSKFRGRFYNNYVVDEASYRRKKDKKLKESYQKDEEPKKNKYLEQRNKLIYLLHKKYKLTLSKLSDLLQQEGIHLKKAIIGKIIQDFEGAS